MRQSSWLFFPHIKAHYSFVSLLKSTSALRLWDFLFFFSSFPTGIQIVCVPRNNGDGKTKQTQGMLLLSLQRSGIVYCLPLITFSLLLLCVIAHYFEHAMCGTQWHAPHNFKHTVTQPRVVTEGLKVYLPCALYKIMF